MAHDRADPLFVVDDPTYFSIPDRISELALGFKLPTVFQLRSWVTAAGLMSYGIDPNDMFRRAADYVDKILKGTKPADLPVEQPIRFEPVINLK